VRAWQYSVEAPQFQSIADPVKRPHEALDHPEHHLVIIASAWPQPLMRSISAFHGEMYKPTPIFAVA
jgi:hypothetical protein